MSTETTRPRGTARGASMRIVVVVDTAVADSAVAASGASNAMHAAATVPPRANRRGAPRDVRPIMSALNYPGPLVPKRALSRRQAYAIMPPCSTPAGRLLLRARSRRCWWPRVVAGTGAPARPRRAPRPPRPRRLSARGPDPAARSWCTARVVSTIGTTTSSPRSRATVGSRSSTSRTRVRRSSRSSRTRSSSRSPTS